ncbi:hypothetical protein K435DRAFT_839882 [Dendrothele bispora CBS 962.96]|uniref:Uncharacterized protein n=1 Tax=Dendrothele bispora (strain CBS 962.96) TaxID=1314807 RepID=A0A4S8LYQ5_DENBC|nr:hypothetical protein K435DRAFT_839882 [Dendrothele bispora CBS 962.96]
MPNVTELVIASIIPPHQLSSESGSFSPSSPFRSALIALRDVQQSLSGFPVYLFTSVPFPSYSHSTTLADPAAVSNTSDSTPENSPFNLFILAGWSSPSAHYTSMSTPAHQAPVGPLLEYLEMKAMVHLGDGFDWEDVQNAVGRSFRQLGDQIPESSSESESTKVLEDSDTMVVISKGRPIPFKDDVDAKPRWSAKGSNLDQKKETQAVNELLVEPEVDLYDIAVYDEDVSGKIIERDEKGIVDSEDVDIWIMKPLRI